MTIADDHLASLEQVWAKFLTDNKALEKESERVRGRLRQCFYLGAGACFHLFRDAILKETHEEGHKSIRALFEEIRAFQTELQLHALTLVLEKMGVSEGEAVAIQARLEAQAREQGLLP